MQEIVELLVFALIALLVGTGVVWLTGWLLGLAGTLLTWLAGLVWSLLRFVVPIALVAGVVYLLVRLMNRSAEQVARDPSSQGTTPTTSAGPSAGASSAATAPTAPSQPSTSQGSGSDAPPPPPSAPPADEARRWEAAGSGLGEASPHDTTSTADTEHGAAPEEATDDHGDDALRHTAPGHPEPDTGEAAPEEPAEDHDREDSGDDSDEDTRNTGPSGA